MNIQSMTDSFNLFSLLYFYGAIAYVVILFVCHLIESIQADYTAAPSLSSELPQLALESPSSFVSFNISPQMSESFLDDSILPSLFEMTIRELRAYIKQNSLQSVVSGYSGKSVSSCSKAELLLALV